jgi:hypothetical protein
MSILQSKIIYLELLKKFKFKFINYYYKRSVLKEKRANALAIYKSQLEEEAESIYFI